MSRLATPPFRARRATFPRDAAGIEGLAAILAGLGPALSVVLGMRVQAHWAEDLSVVRSLGLLQIGGEGVISSALQAGLSNLPFGSVLLRLALLNPLLVGFGSWLVFRMARSLFPESTSPHLSNLLALGAAWSVGLSPGWQQGASTLGSPVLATCLVLLGVCLLQEPRGRSPFAIPAVVGLLLAEARWSSAVLLGASLVVVIQRRQLPSLGRVGLGVGATACVVATCLLPSLLEPLGTHDAWQLGLDLNLPETEFAPRQFVEDVNLYPLLTATFAATWLFLAPRGRRQSVPLVTAACFALLLDNPANRLVLIAACGILSARGVLGLLTWLAKANLPFSRFGLRVIGLLHLSAVLLVAEGGRLRVSRQVVSATQAWSEEAFEHLPASSLVFTSSTRSAWRLWAARLTSGTRPDVLVVPSALLSHGTLAAQFLQLEPKLHHVIRDVAAEGVVSEYALSELADVRPLRVEFDPSYTPRMLEHLVSDGLWFRYAPHPMGRSDRVLGIETAVQSILRVYDAANQDFGRDAATLERLQDDALQHALLLSSLGEVRAARHLVRQLDEVGAEDPRWRSLTRLIRRGAKGQDLFVTARQLGSEVR